MHGDATGKCEGKSGEQRHAPVANEMAGEAAKIRTKTLAISQATTRPARTALVMAASKAGSIECRGIDDSVQASSRPSACRNRNQSFTDRMVKYAV